MFNFWQLRKIKREREELKKVCPHEYSIVSSYRYDYRDACDLYCPHCDKLLEYVEARLAKRQLEIQEARECAGTLIMIN